MRQSGPSSRVKPARSSSRSPEAALVAALAIGASIRGIFNDFVYDDIPIIQDNVRVHQFDFAHVREIFANAYWPPPFVEQLYRPLTLVGLAAQYAVGGGSPMVFRLVSYVLYAATAVLVYRLATRVLDPWPSLGIAALFAVHPVHVEAVALGREPGGVARRSDRAGHDDVVHRLASGRHDSRTKLGAARGALRVGDPREGERLAAASLSRRGGRHHSALERIAVAEARRRFRLCAAGGRRRRVLGASACRRRFTGLRRGSRGGVQRTGRRWPPRCDAARRADVAATAGVAPASPGRFRAG